MTHPSAPAAPEVVVMGRVGADLYPNELRRPLAEVRTFTRFAGGFAANVATGLARLGVRAAVVSAVGADGHGAFIRSFLAGEGVDVRWLGTHQRLRTPLAFCEVWPPDRFPLTFYRDPSAPDWEIGPQDIDLQVLSARMLVVSGTGLARGPSRRATLASLAGCEGIAVLDLDHRPVLWPVPGEYPEVVRRVVRMSDVVVGNEEEIAEATGERDLESGIRALLELGPGTVVAKLGEHGAVAVSGSERHEVDGMRSEVVNGLGAGDAFAAALCRGILRGDPLDVTLARANAAGAIVAGALACSEAMPSAEELDAFLHRHVAAGSAP